MNKHIFELCVSSPQAINIAEKCGVERIELCSALAVGGITPPLSMIQSALDKNLTTNVLIRPREGDFVYSDAEKESILHDIDNCRHLGVHGVVVGALTPDHKIDKEFCKQMIQKAAGMNITFHRAFDWLTDAIAEFDYLLTAGFTHLLTSGCAPKASEGEKTISLLRERIKAKGPSLKIIAAGGVNSRNALQLIAAGADELHGSCSKKITEHVAEHLPNLGAAGLDPISYNLPDDEEIKRILNLMK